MFQLMNCSAAVQDKLTANIPPAERRKDLPNECRLSSLLHRIYKAKKVN